MERTTMVSISDRSKSDVANVVLKFGTRLFLHSNNFNSRQVFFSGFKD